MISATSSLASGILSGAFGTPAAGTATIPTAASASTNTQAAIVSALLPESSPEASLLSNIAFAQDTEYLLDDPYSNGAISGTASNYVQQIISKLVPGATAVAGNSTQNADTSASSASSSSTLPPEGIIA